MNTLDIAAWVLRAFGVLYVVGGVVGARQAWVWAHLNPQMERLARTLRDYSTEMGERNEAAEDLVAESDLGRPWWVFSGSVMLIFTGAAMAAAHAVSVPLLVLIVIHQMAYFVRQRRRELRAPTPQAAAEARPESTTVRGYLTALVIAALAAWLYWRGALWGSLWLV